MTDGDWPQIGFRMEYDPKGEAQDHANRLVSHAAIFRQLENTERVIAAQNHSVYVWQTAATLMAAVSKHGLPESVPELEARAKLAVQAATILEAELKLGKQG